MRINHNIAALNTHRQLTNNNTTASKNIERLSSGLRINRAGDDAAGLAISEKMRAQIRGLDMANRNAQDGISMIQTAEGALNETHSILQRMRELAVQSANDTATDSDRSELQKEISQLKDEIDRISNTTEFNTKKLLNGDLSAATTAQGDILQSAKLTVEGLTQTGTLENDTVHIGSGSNTITVIDSGGTAHNITIASGDYTVSGLAAAIDTALSGSGITSITVTAVSGKLHFVNASGSYTISASGTFTGLGFTNDLVLGSGGTSGSGSANNAVTLDRISIGSGNNQFKVTDSSSSGSGITVTLASGYYTAATLADAINAELATAGVSGLTVTASGSSIKFSASSTSTSQYTISSVSGDSGFASLGFSGAGVSVTSNGDATKLTDLKDKDGNSLGIKVGDKITINGEVNGTAQTAVTVTVASGTTLGDLAAAIEGGLGLDSGSVTIGSDGKITINGKSGEDNDIQNVELSISNNSKFNNIFSNFAEIQDAQDEKTDKALSFQIGANQDQTMNVDINEMSVGSLSLSSVDISTQQGAQNSITVIENALEKVSAERSKLGAFQNRLEHSINNLGTSSENLTAAESRIRDVDMAKEMMEFTKNNILTQAAQSMLAQANQQPQGVLQLLR